MRQEQYKKIIENLFNKILDSQVEWTIDGDNLVFYGECDGVPFRGETLNVRSLSANPSIFYSGDFAEGSFQDDAYGTTLAQLVFSIMGELE